MQGSREVAAHPSTQRGLVRGVEGKVADQAPFQRARQETEAFVDEGFEEVRTLRSFQCFQTVQRAEEQLACVARQIGSEYMP